MNTLHPTIETAHLNNYLKTYHLIYNGNEITSITQVKNKMTDVDGNEIEFTMYDVRFINGKRDRLHPEIRLETIRK